MMMDKEQIMFLRQLIKSLKDARKKLEEHYERKDAGGFEKTKKFMMNIHEKISEILAKEGA